MVKQQVVFYDVTDSRGPILRQLVQASPDFKTCDVKFIRESLNEDTVKEAFDASVVSVFVKSSVTKRVIDSIPNLNLIATRSTGFDHVDLTEATSRGIRVANVPAYGSRTVAEYAFALILGLSRKTFAANVQVKTGGAFSYEGMEGFNLQGKTIGILGTGRIGQNAIQIAKGFDMNVIAYDAFPNKDAAAKLGFTCVSLDELLAKSDVISLHVPYNKDTHHLINSSNVQKCKHGSILVNTARGEVCETEALITGAKSGIFSGVGLDVIEGEHDPKLKDTNLKKLLALPNVFVTPHMAFFSQEAEHEINMTTIENIAAFLRGEEKNVVKS